MKEYKETLYTSIRKSTSDLTFYSAGYEKCEPGYSYGPRYRSYQLIHFVLKGKGELHINEHTFQLKEGDAFIIPSDKISYYKASEEDPWCYVWISFLGIDSENYIYQLMTALDDIYIVHNVNIEKYKELIFEILAFQGKDISRYFYANSLLNQIMAYLFEEIPFEENQRKQNSVADEVKFYLDVNYAEKLVLKDVAKEFGVHPNYMTRIFHEKFGISPKKYLMDLKLKKACHLLTTTSLSIGVIAGSLGFDDQLAFSRIFRKEFGEAPSKYRKKE
nr:AraC family transcriptional regulator [uncultured Anaerostipes sp.]